MLVSKDGFNGSFLSGVLSSLSAPDIGLVLGYPSGDNYLFFPR
jgi:hypothetical protein